MLTEKTVEIKRGYLRAVSETAASYAAVETAKSLNSDGWPRSEDGTPTFIHPGDFLGTILCETWSIDRDLCSPVVASFYSTLVKHAQGEISLDVVLRGIPYAINSTRFPEVDVPALVTMLRTDVPNLI